MLDLARKLGKEITRIPIPADPSAKPKFLPLGSKTL